MRSRSCVVVVWRPCLHSILLSVTCRELVNSRVSRSFSPGQIPHFNFRIIEAEALFPNYLIIKKNKRLKAAVRNFFGLKMIQIQYLRKYITSQCSKLSPYFSPIHNGYLIIMFSNLSGTGRFSREIRAWHCVITSRL